MKRGLAAVLVLAVIVVFASCGGNDEPESSEWTEVAEDLKPGLDPASDNPCQNGDRRCLDLLAEEMERRVKILTKKCDHDAAFATMYLRMTEQIRDAYDAGDLRDPAATSHFTAWFASYYFRAFDDWHGGKKDRVPDAWRIAFEAADNRRVRGIGNLLLGMNAHVSRDLPYVVRDVLGEPRSEIDPDYVLVNELIETLSDGLLAEVAERLDPSVLAARIPLALAGADTFGEYVTAWRGDSWAEGNALLGSSGVAETERRIEGNSSDRALALLPEVTYLPFVENPDARDKYCRDHR